MEWVNWRGDDLHRTATGRANGNLDAENAGEKDGPGEAVTTLAAGLLIAVAAGGLLLSLFGRSGHDLRPIRGVRRQ